MLTFYPADQQTNFTNRAYELAQLAHYRQTIRPGPVEHVALFGLRRIGKTLLLKEFMRRTLNEAADILPVYMDFAMLASSPENFALGFVGQVCYWLLRRGESETEPFLNSRTLPAALLQSGASDLYPRVESLLHELDKARPDRQTLLRQAFHFPQEVIAARKISLALIFDEFQEIRTLTRFPNSQNVLALLRAEIQSQSGALYILAGSAVSVLTELLSNPDSPLFAQFTRLPVNAFDRESTGMLVRKLMADRAGPDLLPLIHSLSGGHPFYITALCRRFMTLVDVTHRPPDADTVKQAFLTETLASHGRIYDFCRYVYDLSLQKASGYGALKAVLQILAAEEGLTASEIARRLRVTSATASDYLRWLQEVDLIIAHEHNYYFRDPVLRFWIANTIRGVEVSMTAEPLDLAGLVGRLDAQFQRVSEELGVAQESAIRELMRHFDGREVDGTIFGRMGTVKLPRFVQVEAHLSPDGQTQFDAVGRSDTGRDWIVEVKWRNKRVGRKELEMLKNSVKSDQAWYVSRGGFTDEAIQYAKQEGVYISTAQDIRSLRTVLG